MKRDEFVAEAIKNPEWAERALDRIDASESLIDFISQAWHIVEPISRDFLRNWHLEVIADHLTAVTNNEIRRLLINVPPGSMKSLMSAVMWPAWEWGPRNMPGTRYVRFSYAAHLSERDNLKTRQVVSSDWYQENWGDRVEPNMERWGTTKFSNKATGSSLATAITGMGTGERGDRCIVDDPHNVQDAESDVIRDSTIRWFSETLQTRINDPEKSAIIVIMQRTHSRDVSGHILSKELGYEHLCIPMEYDTEMRCKTFIYKGRRIENRVTHDPRTRTRELMWPERFTADYLYNDLYKSMTQYAVAGQMQQRPVPREGGLFKRADFRFVDKEPPGSVDARGWDLAGSTSERADWTVGVRIKKYDGRFFVCDVQRFRESAFGVRTNIRNTAKSDGERCHVDLPQDPGQAGKAQASDLVSYLAGYRTHYSLETGEKSTRLEPFVAQVEAGNVYLVVGNWNDIYLDELCALPNSDYDDQGDATARAFNRVVKLGIEDFIVGPVSVTNPNKVVRLHG